MDEKLNISILGTRGIPNRYGGFEECADRVSQRLAAKGHKVSVYTDNRHTVSGNNWNGVERLLIPNPEHMLGTTGQFFYDLSCNLHSRRKNFDVVLHLGYTSDGVWQWLWPGNSMHIVNMDGLEWQRTKYSKTVRAFLKKSEKWAVKGADRLVADSEPIAEYLEANYD